MSTKAGAATSAAHYKPRGKDQSDDARAIRYARQTQREIDKGLRYFWAKRGRQTVPQE